MQRWLMDKVHVNIPFSMLYESFIELFIKYRINPEIGLDAYSLDKYSLSDFEDIAVKLNFYNLNATFHSPFTDLSPGSIDPLIIGVTRRRFEKVLKLIPVFKPETVVCHTGYDNKHHGYIKDKWLNNATDTLRWYGESVKEQGSMLMIENVYEQCPIDLLPLLEDLKNVNAGFCFDIGHQSAFSSTKMDEWFKTVGIYIGQLHLHDNFGVQDDHLPIGRGSIDFIKFFELLKMQHKDTPPVITLEPHTEEHLWPSLESLEKLWPWDKTA